MTGYEMTNWLRCAALVSALAVLAVPLTGCGGDGGDASSPSNGGLNDGASFERQTGAFQESVDAARSDKTNTSYANLDSRLQIGGCSFSERGKMPTAALPRVDDLGRAYTIELGRWGISGQGRDAKTTTQGLNQAIAWARKNSYGTVRLPAGIYLVGERKDANYWGGVELPSNIRLELDRDATIQMASNDSENYCAIEVAGKQDVIISGGTVLGDRDTHPSGHEEGHAICVWGGNASKRVLVEDMTLTGMAGDGILINGGNDPSSKDVTVRRNNIFNNRRQGVSVVGGENIVIENNDIHHMNGASQEFGIDIEGPAYVNKNILIRRNDFYQNSGGDYVNNDGRNVWLLDNVMDQAGLKDQSDGPIVIHSGISDQVVMGNTVRVTVGSSNGDAALVNYVHVNRVTTANIVQDNMFIGGSINIGGSKAMSDTSGWLVKDNVIQDGRFMGYKMSCLQLEGNEVEYGSPLPYRFFQVSGAASGNKVNGASVSLSLSPNSPYSNAPDD